VLDDCKVLLLTSRVVGILCSFRRVGGFAITDFVCCVTVVLVGGLVGETATWGSVGHVGWACRLLF